MKKTKGGGEGVAARGEGEDGGATMADDEELISVALLRPTVHGFPIRKHRKKEEKMASAFLPFMWPEEVTIVAVHGGSMAGSSELEGSGLRSHETTWERDGEKEEKEASSP